MDSRPQRATFGRLRAVPAPSIREALRGIGGRRELEEWLDRPGVDRRALAGNLRDLRLLNRWLGWSRTVGHEVERLLRARGLREATLLDVATGSADIPRAITARAAHHGLRLHTIATDVSADVLAVARSPLPAAPSVVLVQHDAARLPFRDQSVDIATLCLAAHHFPPERLRLVLAELGRVARHGVIVSDLVRGPTDYLLARLMALALRNPLTAHDGPISVLRAYTPGELRALARQAGLTRIRVRRSCPARMSLVAGRPHPPGPPLRHGEGGADHARSAGVPVPHRAQV